MMTRYQREFSMLMKNGKLVVAATMLSMVLLTAGSFSKGWAEAFLDLPNGSKLDLSATCPVCGMAVGGGLESSATYAYRDGHMTGFGGAAASVFKDGKVVGFEGARCLFIYNTIPKRFGINVEDIVHRYVTDFNTKKLIEGNRAVLVLGSSIKGFMGYDLIAFSTREEAERFKSEYGGKRIVEPGTVGVADVDRKTSPLEKR
jgi:copper chaperone NosL